MMEQGNNGIMKAKKYYSNIPSFHHSTIPESVSDAD